AVIGIAPITTRRWLRKATLQTIRKDRTHLSIRPSPARRRGVHRGGPFLCTAQYCSRYIVGTLGKGEINTGTNHLGFRCVKSPKRSGNSVAQTNKRATYPPGSAATIVMSPEVTRTVRSERLPVPRDMSILREDCSLSATVGSRLFVIFPFTVSQWT